MTQSVLKPAVATAGELSPSMWGHVEMPKWKLGASVARNGFINYRGGFSSRGGTAYTIKARQACSVDSTPPKIIRFQFNILQSYILEFGDGYMRVIANGAAVTEAPLAISAATNGDPCIITVAGNPWVVGDWIYVADVAGMTQINQATYIVGAAAGGVLTLLDLFDNPVNAVNWGAYVSGGTAARIYTNRNSPYAAEDLPYLKVVQSADVMSLCCVNQQTGKEYAPVDLSRLAANNWEFTTVSFGSSIAAPTGLTASATVTGSPATQYAYVVTAIDGATGEESVASAPAYITNSVDIAATAGSHVLGCNAVTGAVQYNWYQSPPAYDAAVPAGSNFGYIGFSLGPSFVNTNITPDFTATPPIHSNPFARSAIAQIKVTAQGNGSYTQATVGYVINTSTGSGATLLPVVVGGYLVDVIVENGGQLYGAGDTLTITDSGTGANAAGTLQLGPANGTYPSVPNYFQQRRAYAGTLNNPDTYFLSQTGAYLNFDQATPPIDSDAIIGTPWGEQVNGIQWLQPMPGGLLVPTGLDTWQVSGTSGAGSLVTPSQQSAAPQESNGYSPTVKPLKINYDILYVGATTTAIYDLVYNFWNNIYAGTDISVLSSHLFDGFEIQQWAWARQPFKIVWATRSDGKFLSLTFLKEQELIGWSRHDTNGLVVGNEVATEPPVDAPYFVVKRYIVGQKQWAYYIERMDDRAWQGPEDPWCVDAGLALTQPAPAAALSAAAATGPGYIVGGYLAEGGQGYTAPSASIVDPSGLGSGGVIALTVVGGVITGFSITPGQNYPPNTTCQIVDATGAGATLVLFVSQNVLFTASSPVFADTSVGDVIRMGGGIASVTSVVSASQVLAAIVSPIVQTIPNDPNLLPIPAQAGDWTITTPVTTLTNLSHLEGMQVAVLADGAVVAGGESPLLTVTNGSITLPQPASSIKVGLPFVSQCQTLHTEMAEGTIQGKPQSMATAVARVEKTRGIQIGANQPVASALDFQQEIPWTNMATVPDQTSVGLASNAIPLFTGDTQRQAIAGGPQNWNGFEVAPGMIAVQQLNPLPMNVTALMGDVWVGETNSAT